MSEREIEKLAGRLDLICRREIPRALGLLKRENVGADVSWPEFNRLDELLADAVAQADNLHPAMREAFLERVGRVRGRLHDVLAAIASGATDLFNHPATDSLLDALDDAWLVLVDVVGFLRATARGHALQALPDDAMMNHRDLAKAVGIKPDVVRKRLDRWRKNNPGGDWQEAMEPRHGEPSYVYRVGAIREILTDARAGG